MKRILVVNVNWLGDVVFSIPVFKALREQYPQAMIACLAVPRVKPVLDLCPFIDEVIIFDEKRKHRHWWKRLKIVARIRAGRFDAAFLLRPSLTRALMLWLAGVPVRVGYGAKGGLLLTRAVTPREDRHRSDDYAAVVEAYGIAVKDRRSELRVSLAVSEAVQQTLRARGIGPRDRFVVINAGGNWDLKRWPKENFAALIRRLKHESGVAVVLSGSPEDRPLAEEIGRASGVDPVILAGELDIPQLAALLRRAGVLISADTGPLHLANSVGCEVVGIFGPTRPEITGPRGMARSLILQKDVGCNRAPCYNLTCSDNVCMKAVTADDVYTAYQAIRR